MLILPPPHRPNINLTTLQQPPLHPTRPPLPLVPLRPDILPLECTHTSMEIQILHQPPNPENIIRVQWDAIRYRPKEGETNHSRLPGDGVRAARAGEEGVGVEEDAVPMQE